MDGKSLHARARSHGGNPSQVGSEMHRIPVIEVAPNRVWQKRTRLVRLPQEAESGSLWWVCAPPVAGFATTRQLHKKVGQTSAKRRLLVGWYSFVLEARHSSMEMIGRRFCLHRVGFRLVVVLFVHINQKVASCFQIWPICCIAVTAGYSVALALVLPATRVAPVPFKQTGVPK
jgi:hypothetical protein